MLPVDSPARFRMTGFVKPDSSRPSSLPPGSRKSIGSAVTQDNGTVSEIHDPYAFPPLLTDFQLHLFAEGTFYKAYETLGAHVRTVNRYRGVHFVVWAPNAARVSVVGDFNRMGWPLPSHDEPRSNRPMGTLHSRTSGRHALQI